MDTEELFALSVEDAMRLPGFPAEARRVVELLEARGSDATLAEIADALGVDRAAYLARFAGEIVMTGMQAMAAPRKGVRNDLN